MSIKKSLCPKRMLNGPCGGMQSNGNCEIGKFKCPWFASLSEEPIFDPGFIIKKHIEERAFFTKLLLVTYEQPTWIIEAPPTFKVISKYRNLLESIPANAISVPDNPLARLHIDPNVFTFYLKNHVDKEVVVHITCRDINRLAIKSRLLGLHLAKAEHILALTGDHILLGPERYALPVFDLDSTRLIYLARLMSDYGIDELGRELGVKLEFHIGAGINPYIPLNIEIKRIIRKLNAGAEFFVTQIIFDERRIMNILKYLKERNVIKPIFVAFLLQEPTVLSRISKIMKLPFKSIHVGVNELARDYARILLKLRDFYGPVGAYISTLGKLKYSVNFYNALKEVV